MKAKTLISGRSTRMIMACAAIGWMCWSTGNFLNAQTPANLSPADVVKLIQEGMSDDNILITISNSIIPHKLTGDELGYFMQQGVSRKVATAFMTKSWRVLNPHQQSPHRKPSLRITGRPITFMLCWAAPVRYSNLITTEKDRCSLLV